MADYWKCDKCGTFFELLKGDKHTWVLTVVGGSNEEVDLCNACEKLFKKWLKE
jgi:hypothetical protein